MSVIVGIHCCRRSLILCYCCVHISIGNIEADDDGVANIALEDRQVKLIGPHSIIGRSIIVKSSFDDMGRGGNQFSLVTGNSGQRIAGGVVGIASS